MGVQFEPVERLGGLEIGLLWDREFKRAYPKTEPQAPLDPVVETFGVRPIFQPKVRFELSERPPVPRYWFLNDEGTELVQVQPDRFIHNWRKVTESATYPRYEYIRDQFSASLHKFTTFVEGEKLGQVVPTQCELTYVDHIEQSGVWSQYGQLEEILKVWSGSRSVEFLPEPEDVRMAIRFVIPDESGKPAGRLHVSVEPAMRQDETAILLMKLTARGRPIGGTEGLGFFDLGREWIVRGFAALTTGKMHRVWERVDGPSS